MSGQHGGIATQAQIDDARALMEREATQKAAEDAAEEKRQRRRDAAVLWGKIQMAGVVGLVQNARSNCKAAALRDVLSMLGKSTVGKKQVLVDRVNALIPPPSTDQLQTITTTPTDQLLSLPSSTTRYPQREKPT